MIENGQMTLVLTPEDEFESKVVEMLRNKSITCEKEYTGITDGPGYHMMSSNSKRELKLTIREMSHHEMEMKRQFENWQTMKAEPALIEGDHVDER